MNAFALHLPENRERWHWMLAGITILFAHAAIVTTVALWYARKPVEPNILPAIAVTLAPVNPSSPEIQEQDIAVGPTMQQAEAAPKQPPKVEEKPLEQVISPPQEAEVMLPKDEPKQLQKPTESRPPAPETRTLPKTDHVGEFTQASSNTYNALVFGHLQRFKRYPLAAHGASGTVSVTFVLNRAGDVIGSTVSKSSGNGVLDREALEILHRASPFPAFPDAKPGAAETYIAPVNFAR